MFTRECAMPPFQRRTHRPALAPLLVAGVSGLLAAASNAIADIAPPLEPQPARSVQAARSGSDRLDTGMGRVSAETDRASTHTYPWGEVRYEVLDAAEKPARGIDLRITIRNTRDTPIDRMTIDLWRLPLPVGAKAVLGQGRHNVGQPAITTATWGGGVAALMSPQFQRPLQLRFHVAGDDLIARLELGGDRMIYDDLYLKREIPAGGQDRVEVRLRLGGGDADPLDLAEPVFAAYRQAFPPLFDWPDRRPITRHFFGGGADSKAIRDHMADPENVAPPAAGDEQRQARILAAIDRNIEASKAIGSQGIILWDIEGSSFPHPITYIGDPRLTPIFNPDFDAVADEVFRRIRDAGLLAGVTIRPTQIVYEEAEAPDKPGSIQHRFSSVLEADPEQPVFTQLDAKIRYAKERWGVRMFYVDTNFVWRPRGPGDDENWQAGMIQADVWRRLLQKHPDLLILPEFSYPRYYAYTPAYAEYDMGFDGTREFIRRIYPSAWTVAVIEDANPYAIWDKMLANVRAGDTLMTFSYALARNGRAAQRVHTEADWLNAGPGEVAGQSDERILAALKSHAERLDDPKRRADAGNDAESDARASRALYFQAHLAAERELESAAEPLLAIARSESAHWLHRKQAVLALGKIGELASLGETFSELLLDDDGLGHFAAEALANFGPAAAPIVVEAMQRSDDASRAALHAAGLVGGDAVRARLEAVVEPDARRRSRREAYAALGQLGARGDEMAVAILIRGLESDPGVYGKAAAAEALGVAGGADAARALRSARERHAGDRSMNHLVYQINRALNRMRNQN